MAALRVNSVCFWLTTAAAKLSAIRLLWLVLLLNSPNLGSSDYSSSSSSGRYNPGSHYGPPLPPGVPGYQTYIYKDRRYGYQPGYDPYWNTYNKGPTRAPEDRFAYDVSIFIKILWKNPLMKLQNTRATSLFTFPLRRDTCFKNWSIYSMIVKFTCRKDASYNRHPVYCI